MLRQELPMKFPMAMTTTTTNSNFSKISSIEQRSGEEQKPFGQLTEFVPTFFMMQLYIFSLMLKLTN